MTTTRTTSSFTAAEQGRLIPASAAVMTVVVRAAGLVASRLDLSHVGTPEQQLGLSLGTVLVYLRSAHTARAVAEGWGVAAAQARALAPAVVGRRPLMVGPSTVAVMARLAGTPNVVHHVLAGQPATERCPAVTPVLVLTAGPVTWQVCDQTAYSCLLRAWRQAARLLGDNLPEDED